MPTAAITKRQLKSYAMGIFGGGKKGANNKEEIPPELPGQVEDYDRKRSYSDDGSEDYQDETARDKKKGEEDERRGSSSMEQLVADKKEHLETDTFVDKMAFNLLSMAMVLSNAVVIHLEVDSTCHQPPNLYKSAGGPLDYDCVDVSAQFELAKLFFLVYFTAELVIRLVAGSKCDQKKFFKDHMNKFDSFLVLSSYLDLASGGQYKIMAMFKIVRILRVVRLVRLLRFFKELYIIVTGIQDVMMTIAWVTPICVTLFWIIGIVCVELLYHGESDCPDGLPTCPVEVNFDSSDWDIKEYFGSVWRTMITLFQIMTVDDWSTHIVRPLMRDLDNGPLWGLFFICFVLLSHFGLANVIVGVVCESCLQLAKINDAKVKSHLAEDQAKLFKSLRKAFAQAGGKKDPVQVQRASMSKSEQDSKDGGSKRGSQMSSKKSIFVEPEYMEEEEMSISRPVFIEQMNKQKVKDIFTLCEIPIDDVEELYDMLDDDQSGDITWSEFFDGCMKIRGDARGDELFRLGHRVTQCMHHTNSLAKKFKRQDDLLDRVCNQVEDLWARHYDPKNKPTSRLVLDMMQDTATKNTGGRTDLLRKSVVDPRARGHGNRKSHIPGDSRGHRLVDHPNNPGYQ
jgi:voltage-gated sodium channel